ncbi:hypothetical protein [Sphingomonas echinoides]|jgi:hypothetical protein
MTALAPGSIASRIYDTHRLIEVRANKCLLQPIVIDRADVGAR